MPMLLLQSSKTTEGGLAMSDTPRTDATSHNVGDLAMLCRTLERELNAFVRLVLGDEATLTPSGNAVLAVAKLKEDLEELARLRAGGCARDQRTTQFCAEVVELERKLEAWKAYAERLERAGDTLATVTLRNGNSHGQWHAAKESKP